MQNGFSGIGRRRLVASGITAALLSAAAFGSVLAQDGTTAQAAELSGPALVDALRRGGHVLYIRHASTEKDYADQVSAVMGDCSTQRTLSEAGWREARALGAAMQSLSIRVGPVYSSQYCRAWQTAELAFGSHVALDDLNFEPAEDYSEAQIAAMRDRLKPLLQAVPDQGYNIAYVAHDDPFEAATGIYPEPMGVTYVIAPGGPNGFSVVGSIAPTDWPSLLAAGN